MNEIWKVIVLGIIEGITEFLPISSTGHLIVAAALLDFSTAGTTFEIFIQLGAVIAVIAYFSRDLLGQVRSVRSNKETQHLWLAIAIAFVPAAGIGFLIHDWINEVLFNPIVVGCSLIVGGMIFLLVERHKTRHPETPTTMNEITLRQAFLIGIAQMAALIPGMSRSGSSIVGGMLAGLDRQTATQFSFYLAIPTLGLATLYSLFKSISVLTHSDLIFLMLGTVVAGIVAWASIAWLLRYVSRNNFVAFGYYRILAGFVILFLWWFMSLNSA